MPSTPFQERPGAWLRCRPKQQRLGIGNYWAEIGHRAKPQENNRRQYVPEGQAVVQDNAEDTRFLVSTSPRNEGGHVSVGQVGYDDTDAYRKKHVGLSALDDGHEYETKAQQEHNTGAPVKASYAGRVIEIGEI